MVPAQRQGRLNGWATLGRCELPGLIWLLMRLCYEAEASGELGGAQVTRRAADVGQSANQIPIQPLRLGTVPSRAGSWGFSFGREEM